VTVSGSSSFDARAGQRAPTATPSLASLTSLENLPYRDDSERWPLWKTALLVLTVCGSFWTGVVYALIAALS